MRPSHAAGPHGVRRSGPTQSRVLDGTLSQSASPDLVSRPLRHTAPVLLCSDALAAALGFTPLRPEPGRRRRWPSRAQTTRNILFANATRTSMGGLRASMPASQLPAAAPLRAPQPTMLLAPIISSRRRDRSPILVVAPRHCLPPVECCRGVSPTHAAKSRPRRNVSGGGAKVAKAVAISGPMPGIAIRRRAVSSSRARRAISASSSAIFSSS